MTPADLLALAARCEAATKRDWALYRAVAIAAGAVQLPDGTWLSPGRMLAASEPYDYTDSIDAAASLVPDGWSWTVGSASKKLPAAGQCTKFPRETWGFAATPPLALCAAALRAMAATTEAASDE